MSERYPEHILLGTQWDAVLLLVRRLGFDPNEFDRETTVGTEPPIKVIPQLVHRPTDFRLTFDFNQDRNSHAVWYMPGEDSPSSRATDLDWPSVLYWVEKWLQNVKREQATPNLWDVLEQSRELLAAYDEETVDETNTPFSPEEQRQISRQLTGVKELLVNEHDADPRKLESRIEQLEEASTRMGRRDWLLMFMGVGLTWTLEGLIPPEGLREVLSVVAQGFGHLFGGGVPQLPMP